MIYKAALIGIGRIGYSFEKDVKREQPASHSSALRNNKKIKITSVCDIDKNKLIDFKNNYKSVSTYVDYNELLKKESPDIAVIAVNEEAHYEVALAAIKSKPRLIILEKPVDSNLSRAKKIRSLALKYKVPISINHERRFAKDYTELKNIIKNNTLGVIHSVNARLWSGMKIFDAASLQTGSCSLIHDGTHLVDIIHYLFDVKLKNPKIDRMVFESKNILKQLFIHYESGEKIIYIELNGNKKFFGFELDIIGSTGRAIIGNGYFKVFTKKESPFYSNFNSLVRNEKFIKPELTGYFSNMVSNCVDFLDGKCELLSPIDEGIKTLEVLYEIINKIN